ncbi:MAG: 16S rRNA (guanine(527)-N(7))-methyltransferase RsmG [Rhizobiales bacterium]|nr:16S rRNA (guanine(527)-N(7))-methyltransferase RsmG [Hyphomicrobiales bacterium]
MTREQAREAAGRLNVSRESWTRIEGFVDLLLTWQKRINLISPGTIPEIWERHVLDSLQLLHHLPPGTTAFADLGSGSGFPALPLAIASGAEAHLYESNGKKAAFLREALRQAGAKGTVHLTRLEDVPNQVLPHVQVVTARALAPLETLLGWAHPFLAQGATGLFHKGQDIDTELTQTAKSWKIRFRTHQSLTDSRAVILEVEEAARVRTDPVKDPGPG